jgi:2-iminobutanoate/2-iminopropanoate deaminase
VGTTIEAQTEQVLRNIEGLLRSQNLDFSAVVKTTVFLQNMQEFPRFNEVYAKYFRAPYPARSTVEVAALPKGVLVEIECIARLGTSN